MQREILFRGKRIDNGDWVYGGISECDDDAVFITTMAKDSISYIGRHQQVDPETIGQYTGVKDKNGVKVFVGDKIYIAQWEGAFEVEWDDGLVAWALRDSDGDIEFLGDFSSVHIIVVGNVYDKENS